MAGDAAAAGGARRNGLGSHISDPRVEASFIFGHEGVFVGHVGAGLGCTVGAGTRARESVGAAPASFAAIWWKGWGG
jgi:hypothetical protein